MPLTITTAHSPLREYVSVSALAEDILGISRARLYELIERGAMPQPCYDLRSKRPIFTREQQEQALAVLRMGIGIDGQPVVFYRRRQNMQTVAPSASARTQPQRQRGQRGRQPRSNQYADLVSGLQSLGIGHATEETVATAMAECFPSGIDGQQESDVLRVLFRHFRRLERPAGRDGAQ